MVTNLCIILAVQNSVYIDRLPAVFWIYLHGMELAFMLLDICWIRVFFYCMDKNNILQSKGGHSLDIFK